MLSSRWVTSATTSPLYLAASLGETVLRATKMNCRSSLCMCSEASLPLPVTSISCSRQLAPSAAMKQSSQVSLLV